MSQGLGDCSVELDNAGAAWLEVVCGRRLARGGGGGQRFGRGLEEKSDRRRLIAALQAPVRIWSKSSSIVVGGKPEDTGEV